MIKAAILDIDGVILGHKDGVNFPLPSPETRKRLQNLSKQLQISLCTVKVYFAVKPIILACGLEKAPHIVDAGATLASAQTDTLHTIFLENTPAQELVTELLANNIYTEWYTTSGQYASIHGDATIRESRTLLFGKEATLLDKPANEEISKIIVFPMNEVQKAIITEVKGKYQDFATMRWGINPSKIPYENAFFTHPAATKSHGAQKLSQLTGVSLSETLGVGDSTNDWSFMQHCGYVATLSNANEELKRLVLEKGGYVTSKSVDEDGILDIFDHYDQEITTQHLSPVRAS